MQTKYDLHLTTTVRLHETHSTQPKFIPSFAVIMCHHLETAGNWIQVQDGIIGVTISVVVDSHVPGDACGWVIAQAGSVVVTKI